MAHIGVKTNRNAPPCDFLASDEEFITSDGKIAGESWKIGKINKFNAR